jgi:hypothetical protein
MQCSQKENAALVNVQFSFIRGHETLSNDEHNKVAVTEGFYDIALNAETLIAGYS